MSPARVINEGPFVGFSPCTHNAGRGPATFCTELPAYALLAAEAWPEHVHPHDQCGNDRIERKGQRRTSALRQPSKSILQESEVATQHSSPCTGDVLRKAVLVAMLDLSREMGDMGTWVCFESDGCTPSRDTSWKETALQGAALHGQARSPA